MIKTLKVFLKDLKNIITNPAAFIIVAGLCFIPSLYAWINIQVCWNPYVNTGNLPVAIVNNDEGTVFQGQQINVGNDVVEELKKNKEIGWKFENDWQANYELNQGKCYAMISIPSNFSKDLTSLTTSTPVKPIIIYKANEKVNAIANKITNIAKDQVVEQIKSNFIDTVNKKAFTILNKMGQGLETNKPEVIQLKNTLNIANSKLGNIKDYIKNAEKSSSELSTYLNKVKNNLPKITDEINSLQQVTEAGKGLILSTKQALNSVDNNINTDITNIQTTNQQIQGLIGQLQSSDNNTSTDTSTIISNIDKSISQLNEIISYDISFLEKIKKVQSNIAIDDIINKFKNVQKLLGNEQTKIDELKSIASQGQLSNEIKNKINDILMINSNVTNKISGLSYKVYSGGLNTINEQADGLSVGVDNANTTLGGLKIIVPQLNALINYGISSGKLASEGAQNLTDRLDSFQKDIDKLNEKTRGVTEENLNSLITLMDKNPEEIASFLSSPIKVNSVELYNSGIFGVALTPFYTVLAIWVGVVLLGAILSTDPNIDICGKNIRMYQVHYGKLMVFTLLSVIQSIIVILGDVYILGVHPENFPLLIGFTLLTSFTFTTIIFTLISLMGNYGKAIIIFAMVFQIAGSGGIYPIQTNPEIFKRLQPIWPFTYAIDGFREAIAGPLWFNVYKDINVLLIYAFLFLVLGFLKKPFYIVKEIIEKNFEKSGL